MSRISDNNNFIDDPKGRKWSWGSFKFIGEFTTIDFFIVTITSLVLIPIFIVSILWGLFSVLVIFFIDIILIKEVKGNKLYELIYDYFSFFFGAKKLETISLLGEGEDEEKDIFVYEVVSGFDISNLSPEDEARIENYFKIFYQKITGDLKIIKTISTYRLDKSLDELSEHIIESNKNRIQKEIIASYYENLDSFSKNKMPNLYMKFERMEEIDIENAVKQLEGILELRKITPGEWQAILLLEFNSKDSFDIKRNRIVSTDGEVEKTITKVNFQRNVPSLFMNAFIYNPRTSFVIDFRTPTFDEQQKVKKSIKRWSKEVDDDFVEGKNFLEKAENASAKNAKNEVMLNYLFGNDELKFMNAYVIFDKDNESKLSFKKQIEMESIDAQLKTNFTLNPLLSKQREQFMNVWFQRNEKKWFPTNVSTVTNALPFQNESILNSNGAYIGTVGIAKFPFMFHPFRKKGISGFHTGIISKTGGGKSTLLKILISADYSIDNSRFMIMDPKNEFRMSMDSIGGQTIDVSRISLNPLRLRITSRANSKYEILEKVSEIKEFLFLTLEREATTSGAIMERISLIADYIKKFYEFNLVDLLKGKEFTFTDFSAWLRYYKISTFNSIISKFTTGALSRFNERDNISLDTKSFNFELLHVKNIKDEGIRNAIMFLITSKVIDEIYANQTKQDKISFIVDEAGWFFKSEFLTSKIESIMVEARAFNTKITWATQNITDLINEKVDSDKLISIYSNTEHMFLGQVKMPQRQAVNELLVSSGSKQLSKSELSWIEDSELAEDRGKFLYQRGNVNKKIKVDLVNQYSVKKYFFEDHQFTKEED